MDGSDTATGRGQSERGSVPGVGVPTLIVTGPIGVGKTTVATEVGHLLADAGIAHAVVDFDQLAEYRPRAADDRWGTRVGLANLAAVWRNYAAAGAERLIIARVIESRADLEGFTSAVPGAAITVVRLRARTETLQMRVRQREIGLARDWHLARARELDTQMEAGRLEDVLIETEGCDPTSVAREILHRVGWIGA